MKTAIYSEDGVMQLVLTPENDFEKRSLAMVANKDLSAIVLQGSFYECNGGWNRQKTNFNHIPTGGAQESLMLRVTQETTEQGD